MGISEKSLELNVGTEILTLIRARPGCGKAYLRGLTQAEEHQEGADFTSQLDADTRLYAFQFKSSSNTADVEPYRFRIKRRQYDNLRALSNGVAGTVFYVFPFYVTIAKLQEDIPQLASDSWLLDVAQAGADTQALFGEFQSRTIRCEPDTARVNPEFKLQRLNRLELGAGISPDRLKWWYRHPGSTASRPSWDRRRTCLVVVPPEPTTSQSV